MPTHISVVLKSLFIGLILCSLSLTTTSFSPVVKSASRKPCRCNYMASGDTEGGLRKGQEMKMEMASIAGAKAIAKLTINERTKRAMLAEAVEDRIFELTEEIEQIVIKNDGILEGDDKEEAVRLAKQTKSLQSQYDDLVNGRPSYLLDMEVDDDGEEEEDEDDESFQ